jgi:DNA-binding NarL/FixJ family response regulator
MLDLAEPIMSINRLTARERDVLRALMRGRTNREIAEALNIAEQTVKNHVSVVLAKLQVRNRVELTIRAVRDGEALGLSDG